MTASSSSSSDSSDSSGSSDSSDEDERHRDKKEDHKRKRGHSKPDKKRKKKRKKKEKEKKRKSKSKKRKKSKKVKTDSSSTKRKSPEQIWKETEAAARKKLEARGIAVEDLGSEVGPPRAEPMSTAALMALVGGRADAGLMPAAAVDGPAPPVAARDLSDHDDGGYLDDLDEERGGASFTQLLQRGRGLKFEPDGPVAAVRRGGGGEEVGPVQPERWNEPAPKMSREAVAAFMRGHTLGPAGAAQRPRAVDRGMAGARAQQEGAGNGWDYS